MARSIDAVALVLLAAGVLAAPTPALRGATPAPVTSAPARAREACFETSPAGFRRSVQRADWIGAGSIDPETGDLVVARVHRGDGASRKRFRQSGAKERARPGRAALCLLRRGVEGDELVAAFDLEDASRSGAEEVVAALAAFEAGPRTRERIARTASALAVAVETGGAETRHRAALDLVSDAAFAPELDAASAQAVLRAADRATGVSPELPSLLMVLGARAELARVVSSLEKERADKLVGVVARILGRAELAGTGDALARLLESADPEVRLRAASVLARLGSHRGAPSGRPGSDEGRSVLAAHVRSAVPELEAMALAGLAGTEHAAAREVSLDIVRRHLASAKRELAPVERVVAARSGPVAEARGDGLRLRAAGYFVARSSEEDRLWLRARLGRLDDPAAAAFLTRCLDEPWTEFDD